MTRRSCATATRSGPAPPASLADAPSAFEVTAGGPARLTPRDVIAEHKWSRGGRVRRRGRPLPARFAALDRRHGLAYGRCGRHSVSGVLACDRRSDQLPALVGVDR